MSSSTSSLSVGGFGRMLSVVAAFFLALEVLARVVVSNYSAYFTRFTHYPTQARHLVQSRSFRVAFVGNSATQEGIDVPVVTDSLDSIGVRPSSAALFTVTGSSINTWYFLLNRYFWRPGNQADLYVIPFFKYNLTDGKELAIGPLAHFFTTTEDWPELFRTEITDASQRIDFLVSSLSVAFAARERWKKSMLGIVVPGFDNYYARTNAVNLCIRGRHEPGNATQSKERKRVVSHRSLARLLERAQEHRSSLCFVAFPAREPYELDQDAIQMIRAARMAFIDLRSIPALTADKYRDETGYHLNQSGRKVFCRNLACALASLSPGEFRDGKVFRRSSGNDKLDPDGLVKVPMGMESMHRYLTDRCIKN